MTTTENPPPPADTTAAGPLTPTDHRALAFIGQVNCSLRACLCTTARHGVALRRGDPERARALLDTVRPWPLYKGGQFLFDLMEWEDLMVDGDLPPLVPAEKIVAACTLPVQWLAAATADAPAATRLVPGQRTAAALDLPLRLLASTARTAFLGAAQDLTDLLGTPGAGEASGPATTPEPEPEAEPRPESESGSESGSGSEREPGAPATETELPPLEAGFYLYEDIVLGSLVVLGPLLAEHAPPDTTP
ncbi:hypothetical protein ABZZ79_23350 [Streptomyces sp. NPDC006458]|uniref:hypothetical protein n=1 Tax=Streptomyces sp. NPDC006458 TaxID=3154302 RepID=UPI0033A252EC